ncbi:MAG: hypothetical protein CMJ46_06785 [Planctomyces sp.]|nr:hypothetical protein [Planctomyces sp.]
MMFALNFVRVEWKGIVTLGDGGQGSLWMHPEAGSPMIICRRKSQQGSAPICTFPRGIRLHLERLTAKTI